MSSTMTSLNSPTSDIKCRQSDTNNNQSNNWNPQNKLDFSPRSIIPVDTKPQLLDFEDLLVTNDLNNFAAVNTQDWPEEDTEQILAQVQALEHSNTMSHTLNTPEIINAFAVDGPQWPRPDDALRLSPSQPCTVFDPHHQDNTSLDLETATFDQYNEFNFIAEHDDPMLAEFLPATTVENVLVDMEASPGYQVVNIEPLQPVLTDHDYCETTQDNGILDEFLHMTTEFQPEYQGDKLTEEQSMNLAPYLVNDNSDQSSSSKHSTPNYNKRRAANNLACQKSRKKRRMNRAQLMEEFERQTERHTELVAEVNHLETMRDEWKERLLTMVGN